MEAIKKGEGRKLPKPNNIVAVPYNSALDFFKKWCIFLRPFVPLTNREIDVMASFLHQRWILSNELKEISNPTVLDTLMMSKDIRDKVMQESNMTKEHFYVIAGNLKKNNIIIDGKINPRLIPNIRVTDNGMFQLLLLFTNDNPTN